MKSAQYMLLYLREDVIDMKLIGKRLRTLRESLSLSQAKLAELLGITQSSLNRYENGQSTPTVELFRKYADFFDVSMDYIFARCEEPQGKLYHYQPKVWKNAAEMEQFVEMCFDPKSPYYNRMKESVLQMFSETADE